MSDHGGEENEEKNEEDDDDRIKNLELEQLLALPNDEEWDLSDSEFFNFFQGWQNVPSPSLLAAAPLDNQPIIHHQNNPTQDDPNSKKKRRQERNRDAAFRSRERKKLYVKELEMKSKYFEEECKRLGMMLNCVAAENHALRLSLQTRTASDVSRTKQESAVLFLESLLLGSLLWFLGVMCLVNLPEHLLPKKEVPLGNMDNQNQGILAPRKTGSNILKLQCFPSSVRGKRCKASRTRMKLSFSFAQQALM
ncbi:hypothetical protein DCAR_0311127 [Daucus carota subsp. sativus]|uniref:BZIP domain-containing protein n=1 Tax=Daucus carota subsp. sativus TaxID=79200 RepID=A0A162AHE2_DAUCS|nr:PREDICTED: bZIP transcription factor 60-like [Daucus carota subsp. sativus]WOG91872.1 hypothetical protein DCAR_0311127 [Daucus carota subsp. sativus]